MCRLFFLNDTPTTEIYTYGHPLALHDALPVFGSRGREGLGCAVTSGRPARPGPSPRRRGPHAPTIRLPVSSHCRIAGASRVRSEEHTSELQSLMRISYAVFCLKKKNI